MESFLRYVIHSFHVYTSFADEENWTEIWKKRNGGYLRRGRNNESVFDWPIKMQSGKYASWAFEAVYVCFLDQSMNCSESLITEHALKCFCEGRGRFRWIMKKAIFRRIHK